MDSWWQLGLLIVAYVIMVKVVFPKLGIQG
jgi:hypothetical protein